jgi:hypothetical protein
VEGVRVEERASGVRDGAAEDRLQHCIVSTRTDPKKLKGPQIEKLQKIALDGRRRLVDRRWAASQLLDQGIEVNVRAGAKEKRGMHLSQINGIGLCRID